MEKLRIGIISNAGRGSSILAEGISTHYKLPLLLSKNITGPILKRDNYDFSSGQRIESFLSSPSRQREIFDKMKEEHSIYESFVTDRTFISLASYHLIELGMRIPIDTFINDCRQMSTIYTHVFFLPWKPHIINNRKRTTNLWYQFLVSSVSRSMSDYFGIKLFQIDSEGDSRIETVKSVLN